MVATLIACVVHCFASKTFAHIWIALKVHDRRGNSCSHICSALEDIVPVHDQYGKSGEALAISFDGALQTRDSNDQLGSSALSVHSKFWTETTSQGYW